MLSAQINFGIIKFVRPCCGRLINKRTIIREKKVEGILSLHYFSFLLFEKLILENVARDLQGVSSIIIIFFSFSLFLLLHRISCGQINFSMKAVIISLNGQ